MHIQSIAPFCCKLTRMKWQFLQSLKFGEKFFSQVENLQHVQLVFENWESIIFWLLFSMLVLDKDWLGAIFSSRKPKRWRAVEVSARSKLKVASDQCNKTEDVGDDATAPVINLQVNEEV